MDTLARHRSCFGRRGHPQIVLQEVVREEGFLTGTREEIQDVSVEEILSGDNMSTRDNNL